MSERKFLPFLTILLVAVLLAASSVLAMPALPTTEQAGAQATAISDLRAALPLVFTSWQAESYGSPGNLLPADPNAPATINFFLSRYAGFDGCNWFLGVYDVDGTGLYIRTPSQTRIYCMDHPQEGTFLASLMNTIEYEIVDGKLIGYTTNHQQLITLVPAQTQPLQGTLWNVGFMSIPGRDPVPLLTDTTITAQFSDAIMSGNTGCSAYDMPFVSGPNQLEDDQFVSATAAIGEVHLVPGDAPCTDPENILQQEQNFVFALKTVSSYGLLGSTLVMFDAQGQPMLMFGAAGQVSSDE